MLEAIHQATINLLSVFKLSEVYSAIVNSAVKLTNAKYGTIYSAGGNNLQKEYSTSTNLMNIHPRKDGHMRKIFNTKSILVIPRETVESTHPESKQLKIGSDLSMSLYFEKKVVGVLSILSHENTIFNKHDIKIMHYFRPIATLSILKAQLYEEQLKMIKDRELFISLAAHELRTPLTSIYAYTQILQKNNTDNITNQKYLEEIIKSSKRLKKLINELLLTTKIKHGKLIFIKTKFDLIRLINNAICELKHMEFLHKLDFQTDIKEKAYFYGDKDKIFQAIMNILINSAKFSPISSKIKVNLSENENFYQLTVKDNGIGIPEKNLKLLYNPFFRGENNQSRQGGLGLGLYITKQIIEQHKGKIKISSRQNQGTTVSLKLFKAVGI